MRKYPQILKPVISKKQNIFGLFAPENVVKIKKIPPKTQDHPELIPQNEIYTIDEFLDSDEIQNIIKIQNLINSIDCDFHDNVIIPEQFKIVAIKEMIKLSLIKPHVAAIYKGIIDNLLPIANFNIQDEFQNFPRSKLFYLFQKLYQK